MDDDVVWVHARCSQTARAVSRLVGEAQGMCTDDRPLEEINVQLDKAQRALDALASGHKDPSDG